MINFEQMPRFKAHHFEIMSKVSEWAHAYGVPVEAVERQIPVSHAWCNANPKKAPKSDPVRFLFNWMRIAKSMGNLTVNAPGIPFKEAAPGDEVMSGDDFKRMKEEIVRSKMKARPQ